MFLILVCIFLLFLGFTSNEYSFEITHINTLVQMFKEKSKPDLGSPGSYERALSRQKPVCILPETLPVPIALEPQEAFTENLSPFSKIRNGNSL